MFLKGSENRRDNGIFMQKAQQTHIIHFTKICLKIQVVSYGSYAVEQFLR